MATLCLAGCGSRSSGTPVSATVAPDIGTQTATGVVLTKRWTQILYGVISGEPTMNCQPAGPATSEEPPGSGIQVTTQSFGNCVAATITSFPDGRTESAFTLPDGRQLTQKESRLISVRPPFVFRTEEVQLAYSNGDTLHFSRDISNDPRDRRLELNGQIDLKGQQPATFTFKRSASSGQPQTDELNMVLTDGSTFHLKIPLAGSVGGIGFRTPDFVVSTAADYTANGSTALKLDLRGLGTAPSAWNGLTLKAPGVTGSFALNSDFSGYGQFQRDGSSQVEASLAFDKDGNTTVTRVSGNEATTAGPSAAALAFLAHSWRELFVQSAPMPGR